jgi:hypothetical protein
MTWETYLWRWKDLYRSRLSALRWAREAFRMPWIAPYYRRVGSVLKQNAKRAVKSALLSRA